MTEEGEKLYMDIYDNGFVSNEYKEKFKHLINNFYVGVEENNHHKALVPVLEDNAEQLRNDMKQAKEIIRTFLNMPMPNNEEVFADVGVFLTKAEQFLKEIEK